MLIFEYYRKYGVACDDSAQPKLVFAVPKPAATSSDTFYTSSAVWAGAGESQISKDAGSGAGAFADTSGDPAIVSSAAGLFKLGLTAAEMQCEHAYILLNDTGAAVRDVLLIVHTHVELSSVDVDAATGTKANTTAVKMTGYGSGHGLSCVGGDTGKDIDGYMFGPAGVLYWGDNATGASASTIQLVTGGPYEFSTTADFYNGHIVVILAGTGAGQARPIKDYSTAGLITVSSDFAVTPSGTIEVAIIPAPAGLDLSPGVELSAMPTKASSYGQMLQFLFQRFAYKRYQDADKQILYKEDSSTAIATGSFEDNTTDQTLGKLA